MNEKFVILMQEMSELTEPECAKVCRVPHSCCSEEYCEMAIEFALEDGVVLTRTEHASLPLMGPKGCTALPHFRPMCTLHVCSIAGVGFKALDPVWTKKYFQLRAKITKMGII
jgi:hypothetical protein